MRSTLRRFASVKPAAAAAKYLQPGQPTGLTGLQTHATPRATLLYLYSMTLQKLADHVPAHSLYRQSVEAVTKHRMQIVESVEPAGFKEWAERATKMLEAHPDEFGQKRVGDDGHWAAARTTHDGRVFVVRNIPPGQDWRTEERGGRIDYKDHFEGLAETEDEIRVRRRQLENPTFEMREDWEKRTGWVDEPRLTREQVEELEAKIGAGLIEEVISVAEGELRLVDTMIKSKPWEDLEEKPAEGQWTYFERKA